MTSKSLSSMTGARNRLNLATTMLVLFAGLLLFRLGMKDSASRVEISGAPRSNAVDAEKQRAAEAPSAIASSSSAGSIVLQEAGTKPKAGAAFGAIRGAKSADKRQGFQSDIAASEMELKSGIRAFYSGELDQARSDLMEYLEFPQSATNPGAADFYLGATLIERSMLKTPRAQWAGPSRDALQAFRLARRANYSPLRAYVSPALLKVWDATGQ